MGCIQSKTRDSPVPRRRHDSFISRYMERSGAWIADDSSSVPGDTASYQAPVLKDENPTLQDCEEGRVHVVEPLTSHINGKRTERPQLQGAQCSESEDQGRRGKAAGDVLRSYFAKLCKQLRNPEPVARALFSAGIINNDQLHQASNPHENPAKRVQDILSDLYNKVQRTPEWMDTVCTIFLEESVPYAKDILVDYRMACGDPIDDPPGDAPHFEVWAHNTSVQVYHTPGPPREAMSSNEIYSSPVNVKMASHFLTADTIVEEFERAYSEGGLEKAKALMDRCDPKSDAAKVLFMALVQRDRELPGCVEMVLAHGFPCDFIMNGHSPVQYACINGLKDAVQQLYSRSEVNLSVQTKDGKRLLHLVCEREHLDVLEVLLSGRGKPVDLGINVKDADGNTPLHIACRARGSTPFRLDAAEKPKQIIELLFRYGASPEKQDKAGNTPLHVACLDIQDRFEIVQLILDKLPPGCVDVQNDRGDTCLHIACRHNARGLINLLLTAGNANPGLYNKEGYTPLQVGCVEGYTDVVILILNKYPYTVHTPDSDSNSPLHLSCMYNHVGIARELSGRLPQENANELISPNQVGNSPLHIACEVNNCTLVRDLLDAMHMRRQCSPYLVNHRGNTPLHVASEKGNPDIVALLLKHGTHYKNCKQFLNHQNEFGNTALHIAAQHGYEHVADYLKKRGASKRVINKAQKTPADVAYDNHQYMLSRKLGMKVPKHQVAGRGRALRSSSSAYSSATDVQSYVSHTTSIDGCSDYRS